MATGHASIWETFSKTEGDWEVSELLRLEVKKQMEDAKAKVKARYDQHRHDNTRYTVGEVVVMRRASTSTGESTKLQDRYKGPLVVTEVMSGDAYRVASLTTRGRRAYSTTAHVSQLKSWRLQSEEGDQIVDYDQVEEYGTEEAEGESVQKESRPQRQEKPPVWENDYEN
ncbi:unnamed protein product [Macrosiphum euphorbiae]|uniref:Polyprotein n=1 Tax=Macrosiphum euphorbiae TaxID=13131 RepID=A0AAV0WAM4_9HEMI|nr:unnamed protein product [Macrosiphum euphorbiae]